MFELNGNNLEIVNKFKYLGTFFTPQLSFSLQAEYLITKARSKIGLLFARTPIREVSLDLAIKLFQCYVTPVLEFNMVIWTSKFKEALNDTINSLFTKFLKRWMSVRICKTRNSVTHFITKSDSD